MTNRELGKIILGTFTLGTLTLGNIIGTGEQVIQNPLRSDPTNWASGAGWNWPWEWPATSEESGLRSVIVLARFTARR
jgi:hypothetical protein